MTMNDHLIESHPPQQLATITYSLQHYRCPPSLTDNMANALSIGAIHL